MIKELVIKNFQSHRETRLRFSPGVNCIVGDTDAGKTAVIRALMWLVFNRPSGTRFRSWWGGVTSVTAKCSDGTIKRQRGDKTNLYKVGREPYKAMGTRVPEEVSTALDMSDLNFQLQHDNPFMVSVGASQFAKRLNSVANLDVIATSVTAVSRSERSTKAIIAEVEADILEIGKGLESYSSISAIEQSIIQVEKKAARLEEMDKQYAEIQKAVIRYRDATAMRIPREEIAAIAAGLESVDVSNEEVEGGRAVARNIRSIVKEYEYCKEDLSEIQRDLSVAKKELKKEKPTECPTCGRPF